MKKNKFSFLKIGKKDFFKIKIKKDLVEKFIKLSGDRNEIHINKKFATKYGFKNKIVHGMLVASLYSRFIGMHLPGKYSLLIKSDIKFIKPVFINDVITINGKIIEKNKAYKVVTVKINAKNQFNTIVSSAKITVKVNE